MNRPEYANETYCNYIILQYIINRQKFVTWPNLEYHF